MLLSTTAVVVAAIIFAESWAARNTSTEYERDIKSVTSVANIGDCRSKLHAPSFFWPLAIITGAGERLQTTKNMKCTQYRQSRPK